MALRGSILMLLLGCSIALASAQTSAEQDAGNKPAKPEVNDERFHGKLLNIARTYQKYQRVDADARLALLDCRAPSRFLGVPRISESEDTATHGKKLYYLYAKNRQAYREVSKGAKQTGQIVVKETWQAKPTKSVVPAKRAEVALPAADGDQHYLPGKPGVLFIMYREHEATLTDATDDGWVYATISADRKRVTSAGRVASCVACHQTAPHGRLFGAKDLPQILFKQPEQKNASKPDHGTALADDKDSIRQGRDFLAALFDGQLNLLPEYQDAKVYWLYHDNYLAAKVLSDSHPKLSKRIVHQIQQSGQRESGKIEILFDEATQPLPFRQYQLVEHRRVGDKVVRTERVTKRELIGWEAYADLRFIAAIALASSSKMDQANDQFNAGMQMFDGIGFDDPAKQKQQIYATYKLALALIAASKLQRLGEVRKKLVPPLKSMQAQSGGWITDYKADGSPVGKANVETTCLAILALESLVPQ